MAATRAASRPAAPVARIRGTAPSYREVATLEAAHPARTGLPFRDGVPWAPRKTEGVMRVTAAGWMLLAVAWVVGCATAPPSPPPPPSTGGPLVIRFADGTGLAAADVRAAAAALGPVQRAALTRRPIFDAFLRDLAALHLLAREAEQALPAGDPLLASPPGPRRDRLLAAARIDTEAARRGPIREAETRRLYEANLPDLQGAPRVRFRQILCRRRDRAEAAAARLAAGDPFGAVARRYSVHPSANRGGEMGWHEEGQIEPALRAALQRLLPEERSSVVESRFGYHLVEVEARRPAEPLPFAAVRDRIVQRLRRERREVAIEALTRSLRPRWHLTPDRAQLDRLYHDLAAWSPTQPVSIPLPTTISSGTQTVPTS